MTKHSPNVDAGQILRLSEEVSRISASLAKLSLGIEPASSAGDAQTEGTTPEISEEMVQWIIQARNLRSRFLPTDLFADPAWDMLLELLRAELAHQRIQVSSLCIAANAPATTALRYIKTMAQQRMIVRHPDPFDGRRVHVALAPDTSDALKRYCATVFAKPMPTCARLIV